MVRRGCERAIRALPQGRAGLMKFGLLAGNVVQPANARTAGIVVVKFPTGDRSIRAHTAGDLDHSRRPEIRPSELLLARPDELHRPACGPGQSRCLDRRFPGVLAAVTGAGIGYDHPNALFRYAEGLRQFAAHAERPLRAGPDGELPVLPFGDRGPG